MTERALGLAVLSVLGDACTTFVVSPLDRVRIVQQTVGERSRYRNVIECATRLRSTGGLVGLTRGAGAEVCARLGASPFRVVTRGILSYGRTPPFASDTIGAAVSALATYPFALARTRLAVGADMAPDLSTTWQRVRARAGIQALYAGVSAAVARVLVSRLAYRMALAAANFVARATDTSPPALWFLKQLASAVGVMVSHPFDTIRARLAVSAGDEDACGGARDCANALYRERGIRGFYSGVNAAIISVLLRNTLVQLSSVICESFDG